MRFERIPYFSIISLKSGILVGGILKILSKHIITYKFIPSSMINQVWRHNKCFLFFFPWSTGTGTFRKQEHILWGRWELQTGRCGSNPGFSGWHCGKALERVSRREQESESSDWQAGLHACDVTNYPWGDQRGAWKTKQSLTQAKNNKSHVRKEIQM